MSSDSDNNDPPDNGFYSLFQGPKYLLPVKIPAIIIVIIFYLTYHAIKFTIEQLVNILVTLVYSVLHLITNLSIWIKTQIPLFCIWLYQQIFVRTIEFCYLNVILPFPTWIKKLFIIFRSACLYIWQTILYPLWNYIMVHIFLPILINLLNLMSYAYANLLVPLYASIQDLTVRFICKVKHFIVHTIPLYLSKCLYFCGYILLLISEILIKIISYIYTELIIPPCRRVKYIISTFYHHMKELWPYIYTCIVGTIGSFREASVFFCEHAVRIIVHTIPFYWWKCWSTCRFILFSINRIIVDVATYVYINLLIPLYRCIKYIISTFYYYMTKLWPYIYTCIVCTIGSFCEASAFFCEHVIGIMVYIHNDLLVPLYRWIKDIIGRFIFQVKVFIMQTIPFYWHKCLFICRCILVFICRAVIQIVLYAFTKFFVPVYRYIKRIISTLYYYAQQAWPYIYTCIICTIGSFCEASTFFYEYVLRIIAYVHTDIFIPICGLIKNIITTIFFQVKIFLVHTIPLYLSKCLYFCGYILLLISEIVIKIISYIDTKVIVPLCRYIKSIISTLYYYAQQSWSYIYTCIMCTIGSFCEVSIFCYEYIRRIIAYMHTNIFVPLWELIKNLTTKIISQVKIFIVHTIPLCWSLCRSILVLIRQTVVNIVIVIYNDFLIASYRWIKDVILQIYQILRTFFFHVFTCSASIIRCFYQYILLPLNRKLRSIGSYSNTNFVIPFYLWMKYIIPQVYHYLRGVIRQIGTLLIYARYLMDSCRRTFTACVLFYHEVLKPGARSIMNNIRMFFRQLNAMIKIYYIYFVEMMKNTKSTIGSTIPIVRRQIFKAVRS